MTTEYDIQAIMNALKEKDEIVPDQYDGCYEIMRKTIEAYQRLEDYSVLDYKDLNLVYLTTMGTWRQGIEAKKKTVNESHLSLNDKEYLTRLWDDTWEKALLGEYTHHEKDNPDKACIGLFGTGFFSFQSKTTKEHVKAFIRMCVDVYSMTEDNEMFDRAAYVIDSSFQGMRAASASVILHCLKPYSFPVINSNMGNKNIFEVLGVDLIKKESIETYIDNCRKIKDFRDKNFTYKNYRIFDISAWELESYTINSHPDQFGSWEIISNNTVRKVCDKSILDEHSFEIPEKLREFFATNDLVARQKQNIDIIHEGIKYGAYIQRQSVTPIRAKMYWDPSLTEAFRELFDNGLQHILEFQRIGKSKYNVNLIEGQTTKRVWLISYNKKNWQWEHFIEKCEGTKHGQTYIESWICANSNPKVGDEVFLIKLGEQPRGLIGHGTVARTIYEKAHYDVVKAAEGKKEKAIDVEFDRLINYEQDRYILQEELVAKCGAQHWSPQASGIEIKQEVLPTLRRLWESVAKVEEEMNYGNFDRNIILYGPPGTGKTYNSVNYAVAICEGKPYEDVSKEDYSQVYVRYKELKEAGRIAFTTFHQSYGYEEFIEGIKPKLDSESESLAYCIEDGMFKSFCNRAKTVKAHARADLSIKETPHIWGMLLGGTGSSELKQYCYRNNVIRFGWDHLTDEDSLEDYPEDTKSELFAKHQLKKFIYSMEIGDIVIVANSITSVDGIGVVTGEYEYDHTKEKQHRTRKVKWFIKGTKIDILPYLPKGRKQLPTSYLYPCDYIGMDAISKILNEYQTESEVYFDHEIKPYVFIIDEINRGNISKIFGELITLIEDTKRAGADEEAEAILPYSGEVFSVPKNVYIIGTMNTADRSIALMDTALRRRFKFIEMMPDSDVLKRLGIETISVDGSTLNVSRMLDIINERIEYLFDREHTIGHAFFTKLKDEDNPSLDALAAIFEKNIIPLLQEYFYEDYEKIQLVLGDNTKEDQYKFILDKEVEPKDVFNGNPDIDLPPKQYKKQPEAFGKLQSYKQIGKDL